MNLSTETYLMHVYFKDLIVKLISIINDLQVLGAEYEFSDRHANGGSKYFKKNLNDQDAPCSLCRTPRSDVTMIPGRLECYPGWTKEYRYLHLD